MSSGKGSKPSRSNFSRQFLDNFDEIDWEVVRKKKKKNKRNDTGKRHGNHGHTEL